MKYIRPFIVLHSALDNDKASPIVFYIDVIEVIQAFKNEDVSGSTIQVGGTFYSVLESLEEILRKIRNAEGKKDDKDN